MSESAEWISIKFDIDSFNNIFLSKFNIGFNQYDIPLLYMIIKYIRSSYKNFLMHKGMGVK
jgi:hypothetical protein